MTTENIEDGTSGGSALTVGLGKVTLRKIDPFIFEDVTGGREQLFFLDNQGHYCHQSGYGSLPPDRVTVVA